jgi:hypothetical protein
LDAGSLPGSVLGRGSLKRDFMEDFFRVWLPLKRCLGLLDDGGKDDQRPEDEPACDQGDPARDAEARRQALSTHLVWLSQCPEIIQEAVSDDVDSEEFFERLSMMFRHRKHNEE